VLGRFKRRVLTAFIPSEPWLDRFVEKLLKIMADIPTTSEPVSQTPAARCRVITRVAAAKAAGIAGTLKPRQSFLSTGGESTRPCLINIGSTSHQGLAARRRGPSMRQSRRIQIRGVTPIEHGRLRSPLTETKL
jgi:hypothetical protein